MRYENWDVLLFPRDCKVPLREFKVACHMVQDLEFSHTHCSPGVPTVCCFIPSLPAGTSFQVSLHSWMGFPQSQAAQAYNGSTENSRIEARLYLDGRLASSSVLDRDTMWPHVFTHSHATAKHGDSEALAFPNFRHELLMQKHWSPADNLGRIKLVISEGFQRGSLSNAIERVRNIVTFSFQHAPIDVLERSSIAWPNPSMWQQAPFAAAVSQQSREPESHGHVPRWGAENDSSGSAMAMFPDFGEDRADPGILRDPAAQEMSWAFDEAHNAPAIGHMGEAQGGLGGRVPVNTPNPSAHPSCDSDAIPFIPQGGLIPADLAQCLTKSILDQPSPFQGSGIDQGLQQGAVRSRKENHAQFSRASGRPPAIPSAVGVIIEPQPVRKGSQALSNDSTASVLSGSTGGVSLEGEIVLSQANSPTLAGRQFSLQSKAAFDTDTDNTRDPSGTRNALSATSGNTIQRGLKRMRDFTPGFAKAFDDENEPRRVSPRLNATPFDGAAEDGRDED